MKRTIVLVAMLMLLSAIVARADNTYMPLARNERATTIRVHVVDCPAWFMEEHIAGHRVEVRDGERVLLWATTTGRGDALFHAVLPETVTVSLDTGQSVALRRGEGALAVAFWAGACEIVATGGEQ